MNRFLLTPHTKSILEGRGMHLVCAASICLFQPEKSPDPTFGREITIKGHGICGRCGHKTLVEHFIFNEKTRKAVPKCEKCGSTRIKVVYTQWVVSRKPCKQNRYYYHDECYEAMFLRYDIPFKPKRYRTKYGGSRGKGVRIILPFDPRRGVCDACGKSKAKGEIKMTCLHHWKYAYKPSTVAKNPILVLENTSEFCFPCHMIADAFRGLMKQSPKRVMNVAKVMPDELKGKFIVISELYLQKVREWQRKRK